MTGKVTLADFRNINKEIKKATENLARALEKKCGHPPKSSEVDLYETESSFIIHIEIPKEIVVH